MVVEMKTEIEMAAETETASEVDFGVDDGSEPVGAGTVHIESRLTGRLRCM